jgi:dTDP-4-dehydrorhamnose reductase
MRPTVLITGANGLLGQFLVKVLVEQGWPVVATGRGPSRLFFPEDPHLGAVGRAAAYIYADLDFTDAEQVRGVLDRFKPGVVIHAGAMTQVDPCELDPAACYRVNVHGTRCMLEGASAVGARFVFVSTDFIFDGAAGPYREEDIPNPLSVYGRSKWEAEKAVMATADWAIVRTVLVYGTPLSGTRSNIITWARTNLEAGRPLQVLCDQWRTPTYVEDLAKGIEALVRLEKGGVYHLSGKDFLTPYDMALRTARFVGLDETLLNKVDASTFTQPGRRPARTGFVIDKAVRDLGYDPVSFDKGIALTLGLAP